MAEGADRWGPAGARRGWPWLLGMSAALLIFALVIAITGFMPGVSDPEKTLGIMMVCLLAELLVLPLTFVAGLARDLAE